MTDDLDLFLRSGRYTDSDSPIIVGKAREITKGVATDSGKAIKIFAYVRDLPFDIVGGFSMLLAGKDKASDCISEGRGFCMHKATAFAALCRASCIPARIAFQIVECPDKPFYPEKIRKMYGARPQLWHSGGEVYLNGKWIIADCTVDKEHGARCGRKVLNFDGISNLYTVEGPIIQERGSAAEMPEAVVNRHRKTAEAFLKNLASTRTEELVETPYHVLQGETDDVKLIPPGE